MNSLKYIKGIDLNQIKDRPILDIAASFWEVDRYKAFKTCYRSMRMIDDLVDNRKSISVKITNEEKGKYSKSVRNWINSIINDNPYDPNQKELLKTISEFHIPLWPWIKFSHSMIYDINENGFKSLRDFIKYSEGAAISPGSIFMHLCGIHNSNGYFMVPKFDVKKSARSLALFSYLVHVIRDFQKDQNNNLNYIPVNLLDEYGLTHITLKEIASGGKIVSEFRELMKMYYKIIEYYRKISRYMLDNISNFLEPRYKLSLEIIYSLYLQIFERIDIQNGNFSSEELNPSIEEIQSRVNMILSEYQFMEE